MPSTELFVYGTLRHDQPEHARFCRGVTRWRSARMRGRVWILPSGYRLLVIPAAGVLSCATADPVADEAVRRTFDEAAIGRAARALEAEPALAWIEGEVLGFEDAVAAWPPLDGWEEFTPGRPGAYQRAIVPVWIGAAPTRDEQLCAAWAYVATSAPPGSVPLL